MGNIIINIKNFSFDVKIIEAFKDFIKEIGKLLPSCATIKSFLKDSLVAIWDGICWVATKLCEILKASIIKVLTWFKDACLYVFRLFKYCLIGFWNLPTPIKLIIIIALVLTVVVYLWVKDSERIGDLNSEMTNLSMVRREYKQAFCRISKEIMNDPVVVNGRVYERKNIQ